MKNNTTLPAKPKFKVGEVGEPVFIAKNFGKIEILQIEYREYEDGRSPAWFYHFRYVEGRYDNSNTPGCIGAALIDVIYRTPTEVVLYGDEETEINSKRLKRDYK